MDPMPFDPAADDELFEDLPEILEPSQEEKDLEYANQLAASFREKQETRWGCAFLCAFWRDIPVLDVPIPVGFLVGIWFVVPLLVHWPLKERLRFAGWRLAWPILFAALGFACHVMANRLDLR